MTCFFLILSLVQTCLWEDFLLHNVLYFSMIFIKVLYKNNVIVCPFCSVEGLLWFCNGFLVPQKSLVQEKLWLTEFPCQQSLLESVKRMKCQSESGFLRHCSIHLILKLSFKSIKSKSSSPPASLELVHIDFPSEVQKELQR